MSEPKRLESNGRWRAQVRTARGRGAPKISRTFDTKAEARRWTVEMTAQVQRGSWSEVTGGDLTVEQWSELWLEGLRVRPSTAASYSACLNRLMPHVGGVRLDQLRRPLLERQLGGLDLAAATVAQTHAAWRIMLKAAVDDERLQVSPMQGLRPPTVPRSEVRALDRDQLRALLEKAPAQHRPLLVVAAGTGLRQGELLGLRKHRVDFLRRTLAVEEQLVTVAGVGTQLTADLKTPASRRRVPVPAAVITAINVVLKDRPDADLLFVTPRSGQPWRRAHLNTTVWKPALAAAKLDPTLGMHSLRHTYASWLIASGLHPRVIQARLGHASIVETMDTYGHLFPDNDDDTRSALDGLLTASGDRSVAGESAQ